MASPASHAAHQPASPVNTGPESPALTTGVLARRLGATLVGRADLAISAVDAIDRAGPGAVTFIRDGKFARGWASSRADAAVVTRGIEVPDHDEASRAILLVDNADIALVEVLSLLNPAAHSHPAGVHPSSVVDGSARIDPTASIGPFCTVGAGTVIGPRVVVRSHATIGRAVRIGEASVIAEGARLLDRTEIGRHVVIHPGAVVGSDGFGYRPAPGGAGLVKIPHLGNVVIADHAEIGANTCIDRARFGSTVIGEGTRIDNLCQIAHNCRIGRNCVIAGCTGISGSVTIGDWVQLGGNCGIADNCTIGDGARVAAKSGILSDVPAGAVYMGLPAYEGREYLRAQAYLRRFANPANRRAR